MLNLLDSIEKNIPSSWIFEHYCDLEKPLDGKRIKIPSVFQLVDSRPSMYIYHRYNQYIYKDFSSGNGGTGLDLVCKLFNLTEEAARKKILSDFLNSGSYREKVITIEEEPSEVTKYGLRKWCEHDKKYWLDFNIGSKLLSEYCVLPLVGFVLKKGDKVYTFKGHYIYGFFKKDGTLYKIYQPFNKVAKFIKVCDYIQGSEQIKNTDDIIITKSVKDIMSIRSITSYFDLIAVDSENNHLSKSRIVVLKNHYRKVFVLFDNDAPGKKAEQYYIQYGFIPLNWGLHNDFSECMSKEKTIKTKEYFISLIKKHYK